MPILVYIILSTLFISLLSLAGILTLVLKKEWLEESLLLLVGFSAGTLMGGAFLHLLPEALERLKPQEAFLLVMFGFICFFSIERIFHWRHCHEEVCSVHAFAYLNLIGDSLHNFIDGLVIAGSFVVGIPLGIVTTLAIASHELPQEIGDFGVLIYGGFSIGKALYYNFITALTAVAGGILGFFLADIFAGFSILLLPFTAGGFIYIAASDLIPQMHKEKSHKGNFAFLAFLLGIIFIYAFKFFVKL